MKSELIRAKFLKFFEEKGHKIIESDLLIPRNDTTLLFTGAGMNQFKQQFMGREIEFFRAASSQKCLRTGDIERVGKTPRHHTFFEMLGNFSFGDYFKKEAIIWSWEFLTQELDIDPERLRVSVFKEDDESHNIWVTEVGLPAEKVVRLGPKENFWPSDAPSKGPNGPCGPCSEIFYDLGEQYACEDPSCGVDCECGRFLEIWNLVFTEFERKPDGRMSSLPNKNIDTGMGLERIASVVQNVSSNFETDLLAPIVDKARILSGEEGRDIPEKLNLIADHLRAVVFAIADGVAPSNEKRGYVIRKLIRRAYLAGEVSEPFLFRMVPVVVSLMRETYPELAEKREHVSAIIEQEEQRFCETLNSAMPILEKLLKESGNLVEGKDVFTLVDTYGLPMEVIEQKVSDADKQLDKDGFRVLMEKRKEISRKGSDISSDFIFEPDKFESVEAGPCSDDMPLKTALICMLNSGKRVKRLSEGDLGEVVVSPQSGLLYPESGGQVGDKGHIKGSSGDIEIMNTYQAGDLKVLLVKVQRGFFKEGDKVELFSDAERKRLTALNHSATHLLQAALRIVLGEHVKQSGSYVDENRLRFDFTHIRKLSDIQLAEIEKIVNAWIDQKIDVLKVEKKLDEARKMGALSFFGEKYGQMVRVVSMGDVSMELCGGSHVENTGEIGLFKIISESSIASGLRRIEALTGENAADWIKAFLNDRLEEIRQLSSERGFSDNELIKIAKSVLEGKRRIDSGFLHEFTESIKPGIDELYAKKVKELKKKRKEKEKEKFAEVKSILDGVCRNPEKLSSFSVYSTSFSDVGMELLRRAAGYLQANVKSGVVILGSVQHDKAYIICTVSDDLLERGLKADELVSAGAEAISGGGGGRGSFAQAGGSRPEGIGEALSEIKKFIDNGG